MINSNQGWLLLGETLEAIGREPTAQNPDSTIEPRAMADYSGAYRSQSGILLRVEGGAGGLSLSRLATNLLYRWPRPQKQSSSQRP
jgi:hypothetical protein